MRDRITDLRRVPAAELRANPANWRSHPPAQRQALAEMLDRLGVVDAVIARETPDGLELIDGHLRADLAADETLPVLVVDLDDGEAAEALATLDPLAAMATTDGESLRTLVDGLDAAPPIPYSDLYGARTMGLPAATHTPGDQLRPPIRIYSGKTRSARFIVAALPDDLECYVEPFAGALAVLLARPRARREVANDLNGDIVAFWRAVRDQPAELARRVASTPSARSVFADCAARLAAGDFGDPVERAWCFAVAAQQSLASRGVSAANPSNWRRHMTGAPGGDWHRTQTAPWLDVAERIRRVQLDDIDATTLIGQVPPGAVVYCDPPLHQHQQHGALRGQRDLRLRDRGNRRRGPRLPCRRERLPRRLARDRGRPWNRVEWGDSDSADRSASRRPHRGALDELRARRRPPRGGRHHQGRRAVTADGNANPPAHAVCAHRGCGEPLTGPPAPGRRSTAAPGTEPRRRPNAAQRAAARSAPPASPPARTPSSTPSNGSTSSRPPPAASASTRPPPTRGCAETPRSPPASRSPA